MANEGPQAFFAGRVTLTIPRGWGAGLLLGAIVLISWFIAVPSHRPVTVFIGSAAATFGLLLTAINGIYTRQDHAEQARQTVEQQRKLAELSANQFRRREAYDYMKRWNEPLFAEMRSEINAGIVQSECFVQKDSPALIRTKTHLILNFLEMMAIAYWKDELDKDLCREFFKSTVGYYEKRLGWYMDQLILDQPSAWENFRRLAASWRT